MQAAPKRLSRSSKTNNTPYLFFQNLRDFGNFEFLYTKYYYFALHSVVFTGMSFYDMCYICAFPNNDHGANCSQCLASLRHPTLSCFTCKTENPLTSEYCDECGQELFAPENIQATRNSDLVKLHCGNCGLVGDMHPCVMCPVCCDGWLTPYYPPVVREWACIVCTLINPSGATVCGVCNTTKS